MKKLLLIFIVGLFLNPLFSQEEEKPESAAATLDELLELVKQGRFAESEEASEREDRFRTERNRQQKLLTDAKAERARLERIAEELEAQFEANDANTWAKVRGLASSFLTSLWKEGGDHMPSL